MSQNDSTFFPDLETQANRLGTPAELPPPVSVAEADLDPVLDVPITLTAILGRTQLPVADILRFDRGSIIELDRAIGEPIEVYIHTRLVARAEVVLVDDQIGITLTEIIPAIA